MKFNKLISKFLVIMLSLSFVTVLPVKEAYADAFKVVTIGADLSKEQKEEMLKYFGVTKNDANILEVTNTEEQKYLKGVASQKELGTKSISCSYVDPTNKNGLTISTHNLYWVTENMIKNALITAGIQNANVKAAAPFNVSGTAALTGILKGFENSKGGEKLDENKKKVANEELVTTGKLGEKIGQDQAAGLINEVKKDVIKEKPKTEKEIEKIVVNVTNNVGQSLSQEDINSITKLMGKINKLDLNFSQLKDQLNDVSNKLKDTFTSEEAKSFWEKIKQFFVDIWTAVKNLFSSSDDTKKDADSSKTEDGNKAPSANNLNTSQSTEEKQASTSTSTSSQDNSNNTSTAQ
ncbi:DUF1002 domain-containing protein [Clostridiaceae bacterium 14S0207]|nr:DUF1002 domain-containing protein [Clostridiaceae bacterium 14S0207]